MIANPIKGVLQPQAAKSLGVSLARSRAVHAAHPRESNRPTEEGGVVKLRFDTPEVRRRILIKPPLDPVAQSALGAVDGDEIAGPENEHELVGDVRLVRPWVRGAQPRGGLADGVGETVQLNVLRKVSARNVNALVGDPAALSQ